MQLIDEKREGEGTTQIGSNRAGATDIG